MDNVDYAVVDDGVWTRTNKMQNISIQIMSGYCKSDVRCFSSEPRVSSDGFRNNPFVAIRLRRHILFVEIKTMFLFIYNYYFFFLKLR